MNVMRKKTDFLSIVSNEKSKVHEYMQWRKSNASWLGLSLEIALAVLQILREEKITQKSLAEKMGVSPQQISKLLKGEENLSLETISKLEEALGYQLFEIIAKKKEA